MTRLEKDNFTVAVADSISESNLLNKPYYDKTKEIITQRNMAIRSMVTELSNNKKPLEYTKIPSDFTIELKKLIETLNGLEGNAPNIDEIIPSAILQLDKIEKRGMGILSPSNEIAQFGNQFSNLDKSLKDLVTEVKNNLDKLLENITSLANKQNLNQAKLHTKLKKTFEDFDEVYGLVYTNNEFSTLNNIYKTKFIDFENNFVPFAKMIKEQNYEARLSRSSNFSIRLPRVYYCHLQAYVTGLARFGIVFQYVKVMEDDTEIILDQTEVLEGTFSEPLSVSQIMTFNLQPGKHLLFLKVVSHRPSSQLHMKDMAFDCLSYRNFHANE